MRRVDLADVSAGFGLVLFAVGLFFIYPPLTLIALGIAFLALGIVGSR